MGLPELEGIRIERVTTHYELLPPERPDSDGVDLRALPSDRPRPKEHKRGEPLIRYPLGESPLGRGIRHWV